MPHTYTVSQKTGRLMFHDNIGNVNRFSNFYMSRFARKFTT